MAVSASDFTVLLGAVTPGEDAHVTVLRPGSGYSFRFRFAFGSLEGAVDAVSMTVCHTAKTCVQYTWAVPLCWREQLPNAVSGQGTLTVYVDTAATVPDGAAQNVCTVVKNFTACVARNTVSTAALQVTAVNDNAVLSAWGLYVRGKSRLHYAVDAAPAGGATVRDCTFLCLGTVGHGLLGDTDYLPVAGTASPQAWVTDSRGRAVMCQAEAITVWDYHAPTLDNITIRRCQSDGTASGGGAYIYLCAAVSCTALGGRNSVTLRGRVRPVGGTWGAYTTLTSGTGAILGGTLEGGAAYEAEVSTVDTVGSVCTVCRRLPGSAVTFHLRAGGGGAAFGKRCQSEGLSCGWNASFDGDVAVSGTLTVGGKTLLERMYPVGALYLSTAATPPDTLLGGTWQAVSDCLLLAGGTAYPGGSSGYVSGTGGSIPYLGVYVWRRTA